MYPLSQRSLNHETCTQIKIQGCRKIPSLKNMEGRVYDLVNNHLGVSKNRGTPKWMVKIMENPMNKWLDNPCETWIVLKTSHFV